MSLKSFWGLGGGGNSTPFTSDAFEIWDYRESEIITDGENKYFKGENGHNLLITGYDFEAGFQKGYLYKTAATVSAPVGDADFIAADVNSFFYTSGTPNQISVISLFQNVDYVGKLFSKHYDQSVDYTTQIETYEPRVWQTVLYNNVKTGTELDRCNSYFKVPVEITTNVRWVSPTGIDTADGSKSTPWLTITKAQASAPTGSTIYVKTGNYTRSGTSLAIGAKNYIGLGNVNYKNNDIVGFYVSLSNGLFSGITFDANNLGDYGVFFENPSIIVRNCRFINCSKYAIAVYAITSIYNCVFDYIGATGYYTKYVGSTTSVTFNTCYFSNKITNAGIVRQYTAGTVNIINCKIATSINTGYLVFKEYTGTSNIICNGNTFKTKWGVINVSGTGRNGDLEMKGNKGVFLSGNAGYICRYDQSSVSGTDTILYNTLDITNIANNFIVSNNRNIIFKYNSLNASTLNYMIYSVPTIEISIDISNNYIHSDNGLTGLTSAGVDGATPNLISLTYEKNYVNSEVLEIGQHGNQFFDCKMVTARYNYIRNIGLALILKSMGTTTHENNIFSHNIINGGRFVLRSIVGAKIYNNTVNNENYNAIIMNQSYVRPCSDILIKNNIFKNKSTLPIIFSEISGNTFTTNNNIINGSVSGAVGTTNYTLLQWQQLGHDANSLNQDPNFNSNLIPEIPITIGENLGTNYEDGLDISTNWGDENTLPIVVTKKQTGTNWQVGAYVQ